MASSSMHSCIRTLCPDIFHFSSWFYQHYEHVISQLLVQISAMQCAHEFSRIWNFLRLYVESEVSFVLFNVGLNPNVAFEVDFFSAILFNVGLDWIWNFLSCLLMWAWMLMFVCLLQIMGDHSLMLSKVWSIYLRI